MKTTHRAGSAGRPPRDQCRRLEGIALQLFARNGFEATTVDDIAAAAGIGRRTFFRYFGSKNDVVWGDFDAGLTQLAASLRDSDPAASLVEALTDAAVPGGPSSPSARPPTSASRCRRCGRSWSRTRLSLRRSRPTSSGSRMSAELDELLGESFAMFGRGMHGLASDRLRQVVAVTAPPLGALPVTAVREEPFSCPKRMVSGLLWRRPVRSRLRDGAGPVRVRRHASASVGGAASRSAAGRRGCVERQHPNRDERDRHPCTQPAPDPLDLVVAYRVLLERPNDGGHDDYRLQA